MKRNWNKINKRKRLWKSMGWGFKTENSLNKAHLNCGCGMCRMETFINRIENRRVKLKFKNELRKELIETNM
jgi:hypothetical protein